MNQCRQIRGGMFTGIRWAYLLPMVVMGCAPVQGYSGPKLPDDQVAFVKLDFNTAELDLSEAKIDGYSFGTTVFGTASMAVLPGKHQCSVSFAVKGEEFDCRVHKELDTSGFSQCKKEQKGNSSHSCDCMDYLVLEKRCMQTLYDLQCTGSFMVGAGRKYQLELSGDEGSGSARLVADGVNDIVATTICSSRGRRVQSTKSSIGRGRATANYNGIYSCNSYLGF